MGAQVVSEEDDRTRASDDGILGAIIFVVVSLLLIATLPLPQEGTRRSAGAGKTVAAPAGARP